MNDKKQTDNIECFDEYSGEVLKDFVRRYPTCIMISDDGFVEESAEYKVVSMMQHVYMARSVNDELVNFRGTLIAVHRKEEE